MLIKSQKEMECKTIWKRNVEILEIHNVKFHTMLRLKKHTLTGLVCVNLETWLHSKPVSCWHYSVNTKSHTYTVTHSVDMKYWFLRVNNLSHMMRVPAARNQGYCMCVCACVWVSCFLNTTVITYMGLLKPYNTFSVQHVHHHKCSGKHGE